MKVYITVYEMVWDFYRTDKNLIIEVFTDKQKARTRYWELVAQAKEKKKGLTIPTDDDEYEWVEECSSDKWELYLSGSWAEFRFTVLIRNVEIS